MAAVAIAMAAPVVATAAVVVALAAPVATAVMMRIAVPDATHADAHARCVTAAVAPARTVIAAVTVIVRLVDHRRTFAIVGVALVAVAAHVAVAGVVVATRQRGRAKRQRQSCKQTFHGRTSMSEAMEGTLVSAV